MPLDRSSARVMVIEAKAACFSCGSETLMTTKPSFESLLAEGSSRANHSAKP